MTQMGLKSVQEVNVDIIAQSRKGCSSLSYQRNGRFLSSNYIILSGHQNQHGGFVRNGYGRDQAGGGKRNKGGPVRDCRV